MQDKVNAPSIALMVVGGLVILLGLLIVPINLINPTFRDQYMTGNQLPPAAIYAIMAGMTFYIVAVGAFIIFGATRMRALKGYPIAMAAAILAMIPCCSVYCCVPGLPVGIWALIVLMDPAVKQSFTA